MAGKIVPFSKNDLKQFPLLHYNEENDSVLCFICAKQNAKENLISATKKEEAFLKVPISEFFFIFLSEFKHHPKNFRETFFDLHKTQIFYEFYKTFKFAAILAHHSH